jgi:flagellar protein FlaG
MSFALPPVGSEGAASGAAGPPPTAPPARAGFSQALEDAQAPDAQETAPPVPPAAVQADLAAARRYEELRSMGRELHFRVEEDGQVVVDVCDLEGQVMRTVPPSEALAIIDGAPPG